MKIIKITENDLKQAKEFSAFINKVITDEFAKKIIEEANKACSKCKEWKYCEECEYRRWRNDEEDL